MTDQFDEFRFERLSDDNIHHLEVLFRKVFNKPLTVDFLKAKYDTSYLGKKHLGHLAFYNNTPVAYGGYVPYPFVWNNVYEIGAQSVDSMSTEAVRGKGVFGHIYQLNIDLLISEGINFGYGFANEFSEPVFIEKFGWTRVQPMQTFVLELNKIPAGKILSKLGLNSVNHKRSDRIFEKIRCLGSLKNPYDSAPHTLYSDSFFKYKSFQDHWMLKVDEVKVWAKIDHNIAVGSIESTLEHEVLNVVESLIRLGQKAGLGKLIMQFSQNSIHAEILRKKYNYINGLVVACKPLRSQIPFENCCFSYSDIDTF